MAWVRHHMERQMLEHIVLDYHTVHRRDGRANNRQAVRAREGGLKKQKKTGKKRWGQMTEGK